MHRTGLAAPVLMLALGVSMACRRLPTAEPPHRDAPDTATRSAAGERRVFAHYMVCVPRAGGGATLEDYKAEIRAAQRRGIDGFALNCGGWTAREPHYKARSLLLYEAARQLDTGFLLFLSADFASGLSLDEVADMVSSFADHPNQFRWNGKPVLSTFAGEGADNAHGRQVIDWLNTHFPDGQGGRTVAFVPYFYPRPNITELPEDRHVQQLFSTFPDLDGYFYFGAAGSGEQLAGCNERLAAQWLGAGKVFMASVTPFYRGLGGNYRVFETEGYRGLVAEWESAIRSGAPWVEIVTWNDWGEASYIAPFGEPAATTLWNGHWGAMLSHEGFLDLSRYYIEWFKTGRAPAIPSDELFYAYRLHPKDVEGRAKPGDGKRGRPSGADALRDSVFVTARLTAPARLTIHSGDRTEDFDLAAGVQHAAVPFGLGAQRFVLTRNGQVLIDKTGEHAVSRDGWSNFNAFAGIATAAHGH